MRLTDIRLVVFVSRGELFWRTQRFKRIALNHHHQCSIAPPPPPLRCVWNLNVNNGFGILAFSVGWDDIGIWNVNPMNWSIIDRFFIRIQSCFFLLTLAYGLFAWWCYWWSPHIEWQINVQNAQLQYTTGGHWAGQWLIMRGCGYVSSS